MVTTLSFRTWVALAACSGLKVDLQLKIQHKVQHVYVVMGKILHHLGWLKPYK